MTAPSIRFQQRYAYQALQSAIGRGEPEIICLGPRGCGKTLGICYLLYSLAVMFPGMTQLWLRDRRTLMTASVLATFEDEVLGIGHPLRTGISREGRTGYDLANGSRIILIGMDDPDRTKSISADVIWVNECAALIESDWEELGGSTRMRVGVSSFAYQLKIGDANPMPPAHWTNRRCRPWPTHLYPRVLDDGTRLPEVFTPAMYLEATEHNLLPLDRSQHKAKLIQWYHADNPGYWSVEPWAWLPPGLKYVQDQLGRLTGNRKARYLEGRPVAGEGVVYDDFDREIHVCAPFPGGWPRDWPVWVGYDPGYSHPCAVVFWGVAPTGQNFIIDEIHGSGIDIDTLAKQITDKARKYRVVRWLADPRGAAQRTQIAHGETVIGYMSRVHQLHFQGWLAASGKAIQDQVESVRVLLLRPQPLQVWETCPGVIGEFESWKNKTNASGELAIGDDAYENRNNDAMDAIRGIVADNPKYEQHTIRSIRSLRRRAQENEDDE